MNSQDLLEAFLSQPNRDISLPYVTKDGTHYWYDLDGKLHRDNDLPSVIEADYYGEGVTFIPPSNGTPMVDYIELQVPPI